MRATVEPNIAAAMHERGIGDADWTVQSLALPCPGSSTGRNYSLQSDVILLVKVVSRAYRLCASDETLREDQMHAMMRTYSGKGAKEFYELLEKRKSDVEQIMRSVKGFVSYSLVKTADGGVSFSIFQDKAGIDESNRKAREWTKENAANLGLADPKVTEGTVVLHLK